MMVAIGIAAKRSAKQVHGVPDMAMTLAEMDVLASKPGHEGALWRLIKLWNTDRVGDWLRVEQLRGTPVDDLTKALAEVLASAAFGLAINTENMQDALMGRNGVIKAFERSLQAKVSRRTAQTPGGIFLPSNENGLS